MSLFDILSGRIEYFNEINTPAYNNISGRIEDNVDGTRERFFAVSLALIATKSIDLFFKPGVGLALRDVKKYNQHDFEKLYAIFIIWSFHSFYEAFDNSQESILKGEMQDILDLNKEEFNYYYKILGHKTKAPAVNVLWTEIMKIIHTMPQTEENYSIFCGEFFKIWEEAYQKI